MTGAFFAVVVIVEDDVVVYGRCAMINSPDFLAKVIGKLPLQDCISRHQP